MPDVNQPFSEQNLKAEHRVTPDLKSIHSTNEGLVIKDESLHNELLELSGECRDQKLSGIYKEGTQYYDLRSIHFINNNDIVHLVDLLQTLLKKGIEVRFVNVTHQIKKKIHDMGLDHVLICI